MAETGLAATGPLGGTAPYTRSRHGVTVSEAPDRALATIAMRNGQEDALRAAVSSAFRATLPEPGCWSQADGLVFSWAAPGQWYVGADGDSAPLIDALERATGDAATVVDQSDAWARLAIAGPQARAVLEKLCPLDLHPSVFPVGSVAPTLMDHLGITIALMDKQPRFDLWVERSAARSFLHALVQAADSTCGPG